MHIIVVYSNQSNPTTTCVLLQENLLRYITNQEKMKILHGCHVDPTAGHMGRERTIHRIKERFMWHGMVKDVNELVS